MSKSPTKTFTSMGYLHEETARKANLLCELLKGSEFPMQDLVCFGGSRVLTAEELQAGQLLPGKGSSKQA